MSKFFGNIGFVETTKQESGVWEENIISRQYYGDLLRNARRLQTSDKVNDDIQITNQISIVSDPYALQNFHSIRYVSFMGALWKVTDVEVQYPRLVLTLGGVYNGPKAKTTGNS